MSRTVGSHGPSTLAAIHEAGLQLIYEHGYEAMTLRQLARQVGLQAGSLYNHIETKQQLLFDLIHNHMIHLMEKLDEALEGAENPDDALRRFIAFHLIYHIEKKREVFIGSSEIRSLEPENQEKIVTQRRAYEDRLCAILDAGVEAEIFKIGDSRISTYAILAMLTGICTWYDPAGRVTQDELIKIHTALLIDGVSH